MLIYAVTVAQSVRALVPQAEGGVFKSQPKRAYVVKTSNARQQLLVSRVLGDDHYNPMPHVTICVTR